MPKKRNINVLLTSVGCPGGPSIIKSLRVVKERKIKIIGTDMGKFASGFFLSDKFYIVPGGAEENYIDEMLKIVKREKPDVLIPLSEPESLALSRNKKLFEDIGTKVVASNYETIKIAANKAKTYEFFKKNDIPVPDFFIPKSWDEFLDSIKCLGYPEKQVCLKPTNSSGTRGFFILDSKNKINILEYKPEAFPVISLELLERNFKDCFPSIVVMEYLSGTEYSIDTLTINGETLVIVPRKRVRLRSGITEVGVVEKNESIEELIRNSVKFLKTDYSINIQARFSDSKPKVIEVNPRLSGTVILCVMAGVNLPYLSVKLALGEEIEKVKPIYGTWILKYSEGICLLEEGGKLKKLNWEKYYQ